MEADPAHRRRLSSEQHQEQHLEQHLEQCRSDYIHSRRFVKSLTKAAKVKVPVAPDVKQGLRFQLHMLCNTNVLVYIMAGGDIDGRRARAALSTALHKANPTLYFEKRSHFIQCSRPDVLTIHREDMGMLISDHLALCDWTEAKVEAGKLDRATGFLFIHPCEVELQVVSPIMRAIIMWYTPPPRDSESDDGHVTLMLTGDYSRMCSGPINFDDLRVHQLPGYPSTESKVTVSLEKAAHFMAQLDRREIAANETLRNRNEKAAEILGRDLLDWARERCTLAATGQCDIGAEGRSSSRAQSKEKYDAIRNEMEISNRQAALWAGLDVE